MEKELSVSANFKLIESIRQKPRKGWGCECKSSIGPLLWAITLKANP